MSKNLLTSTLLAFLLTSAAGAANLFPLEPGNTWTYRATKSGHELRIQVGLNPILVGDVVYHKLTGYVDEPVLVRAGDDGSLYYLDEDYGELPLTLFEPTDRYWFNAPKRGCEHLGQTQTKRYDYAGRAGRFASALAVEYRTFGCADAGIEEELYTENIGMLSRTVQSFAGPVTYELVYASLGPMTIVETPRTSFHLTLKPSNADLAVAVMRLEVAGGLPLKLVFPSAQQYDAVLRDEGRNVVWRWSDGQYFVPAVTEKAVTEFTAEVPVPGAPNGVKLPPGTYTLEAWLATTEPEARFAATAHLQVWDTGIEPRTP